MEKKITEKKPTVRKTPVRKAAAKVILMDEPTTSVMQETKQVVSGEFVKAIGRRKEASAQVKVYPVGKGTITVNGKDYTKYFALDIYSEAVLVPLKLAGRDTSVDVTALVRGGGLRGQADAVRLGISRALLMLDETLRKSLKKSGLLTRDPRVKERKKYGLKKARRAPQWAKR